MSRASLVKLVKKSRAGGCRVARLRPMADELLDRTLAILFPHFAGCPSRERTTVPRELQQLERLLGKIATAIDDAGLQVPKSPKLLLDEIEGIHAWLTEDAQAFYERDPAAKGIDEVVLAYPGYYAIASQRIAHALHRLRVPFVPRLITEKAHERTGVDIHPGARIGRRFVIDHGTGVVIGESTEIGNGVTLYQGVTLGALAVEKELADQKRHPTIEDHVVIYANATILGGRTVIGHDSVIGGNAWITQSVPPYSQVTQTEVRRRVDRRSENPEFVI